MRNRRFPTLGGGPRRSRRRLVLGLVALVLGIVAVFALFRGGPSAPHHAAGRVLVLPPPGAGASAAPRVVRAAASRPRGPALAPLPPPSGRRVLPVAVGAHRDFVSPSLSLPSPPSGWYLQVGKSGDYARARRILQRFDRARFKTWISPRATAAGSEIYRVWIGPYKTRSRVEATMLRATALAGVPPEVIRHRRHG